MFLDWANKAASCAVLSMIYNVKFGLSYAAKTEMLPYEIFTVEAPDRVQNKESYCHFICNRLNAGQTEPCAGSSCITSQRSGLFLWCCNV